jgi:PPK2 family polyphosphate:nucleotide phosphotransferase
MKEKKLSKHLARIANSYKISDGSGFRLKDYDPADTGKIDCKETAEELLQHGTGRLIDLQEKLYAQDRWALLVILQGLDAGGKDGAIKHVMSGVNPQGCDVHAFKVPSAEELEHDYLWRAHKALPERGKIGIFNRSYYEEVLVARVHPKVLSAQKLPDKLATGEIWDERFADMNAFERYLARNGVMVVKFFLHLSKKEQKRRFLERLDDPRKNWKFSMDDLKEREHWKEYQDAFEQMVMNTATKRAPWYVVPADNKWFTRLVVAGGIIHALEKMELAFPKVDETKRKELTAVRKKLVAGKD